MSFIKKLKDLFIPKTNKLTSETVNQVTNSTDKANEQIESLNKKIVSYSSEQHKEKQLQSNISKLKDLYRSYNYENIPEIENEKSAKWVLANLDGMFGAVLVPKEYMSNISKAGHNYVTGEIVLLWWLTSRKNKSNKPLYFYRTYGIDADKSIKKLINTGLLTKDMKLTTVGKKVLDNSKMIIKHHRASKSWSGIGPVKYTYPKKVKTKLPVKYADLPKKQQYPWSAFDINLQDAKSEHCRYIQWLTSTHPCKQCKKIGSTDTGKGPGIYLIKDAPLLRNQIHPGCTCRIFPYKLSERNLPPVDEFSTRDPETGKSIIIKAKQY